MASITCNNCNLVGHRYTSCHKTLKPALAMRKNRHEVSLCLHTCCHLFLFCTTLNVLTCCHFQMQSNRTEEGTTSTTAASSIAAPARRASTTQASRAPPGASNSIAPASRPSSSAAPASRPSSSAAPTNRPSSSVAPARRPSSSAAATRTSFLAPRQRKKPSRLKDYFYASGN